MNSMTIQPFHGFTPDTLEFLHLLAANNCKEWFEAHREEYRQNLLEPLQQLAAVLAGPLCAIDPDLITEPRRVVSRIYRDTRFSRGKSPYKTTMWLTFKRPLISWQDAPAFFFELSTDAYRYGMGFYGASRATMDRLREIIAENPDAFRHTIEFLADQKTFVLAGDRYKKLHGGGCAEDLLEWYQRKNLHLICTREIDDCLFSPRIVHELTTGFALLAPLYDWLWQLRTPNCLRS